VLHSDKTDISQKKSARGIYGLQDGGEVRSRSKGQNCLEQKNGGEVLRGGGRGATPKKRCVPSGGDRDPGGYEVGHGPAKHHNLHRNGGGLGYGAAKKGGELWVGN